MKSLFEHCRKWSHLGILITLLFAFAHCGSGSGGSGGGDDHGDAADLTEAQQADALSFIQSIADALGIANAAIDAVIAETCTGGSGTVSSDADDFPIVITFDNCDLGSFIIDGTLSLVTAAGGFTITYDFTVTPDGDDAFTVSGTIAISDSPESATFNLSATISGTTIIIAGTLTLNADDTGDGTLTVTVDGTLEVNCVFDDFDTDIAECADYTTACGLSAANCP